MPVSTSPHRFGCWWSFWFVLAGGAAVPVLSHGNRACHENETRRAVFRHLKTAFETLPSQSLITLQPNALSEESPFVKYSSFQVCDKCMHHRH